jgi:iron complex outermembrane receptor protein
MLYHQSLKRVFASAPLATLLAVGLSQPVLAQNAPPDAERALAGEEQLDDDVHNRRVNTAGEIVVTATGITELDILAGTSVLEGIELQRELDGQLGEVLAKLPGVSATGFSPGASRPVLRGFSGERVKVLIDGLGNLDVSNTSDDHAVSIDPLTAERIDVLRGPAVIIYGSQAIGGAVNVIDKRIPQRVPNEAFHLDTVFSADTASNLLEGGASIDIPLSDRFVVHFNGSYRNTDDVEVGGFTVAPGLRAELLEAAAEEEDEGAFEEAEELREAAQQRGVLPNSATETWSADAGFAFIDGDNSLGFAIGYYDTNYGVPGRPGAGHHHGEGEEEEGEEEEGEEFVTIGLEQFRADMRGQLDLGGGFFSQLVTRAGFSDYTHTEFEGAEVGTVFDVTGIEARAELVQKPRNGWRGSMGVQYYHRDFAAEGAEAYVPPNLTDQLALFTLQEINTGPVQFELAGRYEDTRVESRDAGIVREFDSFSGALSIAHEIEDGPRFGITGSHAERAPSAEELFSDGPHIATQAFEVGDANLKTENAWGVEAFIRGPIGLASVNLAVFKSWFDNYIYLSDTGLEEDDLPVFEYLQDDVEYFGIEAHVTIPLVDSGPFTLLADLRGDYIEAELDDGTPLPRIPPMSLLGALEAQTDHFDLRGEVQWFDSQKAVSPFETETDGFTLVNASVAWRPFENRENITLIVQADNIFDVTGRRHTSFTKDFVPVVGRNFKVSLRTSF